MIVDILSISQTGNYINFQIRNDDLNNYNFPFSHTKYV